MKRRSQQHSLLRQELGYRWPERVMVWRPHRLRCPLRQALQPRHRP
jgi:hypothetical protein